MPLIFFCLVYLHHPAMAQYHPYYNHDTLKSFLIPKERPYLHNIQLRHREKYTSNQIARATLYSCEYNLTMGTYLLVAPEWVTNWHKKDKFKMPTIRAQYRRSFTTAPIIDDDLFAVNYFGHPYQGGYYYNALRSQGASAWHSALFCTAQSVLWEYVWEGGMEQPSIQDLISTPIGGIIYGELTHMLSIKMGKNGYTWVEAVVIRIMNPAFAFNNRLRIWKLKPQYLHDW